MALVVTDIVADRQIFRMAISTFAQGLDVFQRGRNWQHMLAANPAGNNPMQLAGHGFVNFVAGVRKSAHDLQYTRSQCTRFFRAGTIGS